MLIFDILKNNLALNNDIEGAISNFVSQLGREAEFNKLNSIQRKAIADSIGVSGADMAKMVANQDKSNMLAGETAKSFGDIIGKEALSEFTAAMNSLKVFGVALANTIGPFLMLAAEVLIPVLQFTGNIATGISRSIRGVDDIKTSRGGIRYMTGPAGTFELNPRDSVLATTNPIKVNDFVSSNMSTGGGGNQNVNVNVAMRSTISGGDIRSVANGEQITQDSGYASLIGGALS